MNIAQSLQALSAYPIPSALIANVAESEGLDSEQEVTTQIRQSKPYKRAQAGVYGFLATAPNVSQGGISYSLSSEDKAEFRRRAASLMDETGGGEYTQYGYISDNF